MYEVEVKVRADHATVVPALDNAGATRGDAVVQKDTYYDAPHRDFAETDEALRIRREWEPAESDDERDDEEGDDDEMGDDERGEHSEGEAESPATTRITYKGPLLEAESKSREEHETAVADGDAAVGIFDGLGFEPAATVRKEREEYRLDGYTVTLDRVDGLGEFVEVETETADDGIEEARDGALEVLDSLGLDPAEQIRTSYLGLLLEGDAQQ